MKDCSAVGSASACVGHALLPKVLPLTQSPLLDQVHDWHVLLASSAHSAQKWPLIWIGSGLCLEPDPDLVFCRWPFWLFPFLGWICWDKWPSFLWICFLEEPVTFGTGNGISCSGGFCCSSVLQGGSLFLAWNVPDLVSPLDSVLIGGC